MSPRPARRRPELRAEVPSDAGAPFPADPPAEATELPAAAEPREATGRQQIMSSGVWLALSSIAPMVATAALSVVIGRILGARLLGEQSLIAYGGSLLGALLVGSLTNAAIQHLAAHRDEPSFQPAARWVVVAHSATGLGVGVLLAGFGLARGQFVAAWLAVALSALLDAVGWGYAARIIALRGWKAVARGRLASQLAAIGLGLCAVLTGLSITGIFLANCVASAALLGWLWQVAPRGGARTAIRLPSRVWRLWGVFTAGAVLTQIVAKRIEFLFLGAYSTAAEIAAYSIAVTLVGVAIAIPNALAGAAMPSIAAAIGRGDEQRAHASLASAMRVTAVASLPLTAILVAAGPAAVTGLYGADFDRAAQLTPLAALTAAVVPVGQLCSTYWAAVGKLKLTLISGIAGGLVDLGLAFWLIPGHGATGAVIASLGGQAVAGLGNVIFTWHAVGRFASGVGGWLAAATAAVPAAVGGRLCSDLVGSGIPGAALGSVVALAVFAAAAALLARLRAPALTEQDGSWLSGALPGALGPLVAAPLVVGQPLRSAER